MPKIYPFLWFSTEAEDAARFYVSVFKNARITDIARYGAGGPGPAGSVMTVAFEIDGLPVVALNGGPHFTLNEAFSLVVECDTQDEIDRYWQALLADGGAPSQCGWLKDRFGLSWQIVPRILAELMTDPDAEKAQRATTAMLGMIKLNIAALQRAHAGG